ncbi:MAG: hypothetical protein EOP50_03360 [Sphingobacteriales bacterium]|nr:MAG: hypothetical protein EOP50_03360 [Sphingobacteriales bacterium]
MTPEENRFRTIGASIEAAGSGQLFGKPCFKKAGKAFTCFFQNEMVFKLAGPPHADALAVPGAKLFDPSGKGRPMKEWVQVPASGDWESLARAAAGIE